MSALEILQVLSSMFGGLALFLFGMNTMSGSLSTMTGGVLNKVLSWVTKNRFFGFIFGTVLTAVVQSSSAVSVLTVGLVNSRIIKLRQAIGLLIGAGLGTTATAWLLSLNAIDGESLIMTLIKPSTFAPFLAIVAVAMTMFSKSEKTNTVGSALLGFSVMMIGMNLMSQGVAPLKTLPWLQDALMSFTNPILGFLFAILFTMLIQSSDATVGIIQAFALSVGVTFGMAIPLVCGAQVGTCITALISSLGAGNNGKRTAFINLYYNLLKTIPFLIIFYAANEFMHFAFLADDVGAVGIPVFHTLINLLGAVIWLPGGDFIVMLSEKTIPYSDREKQEQENVLTMLDVNLLSNPTFALEQTDIAVQKLADTAREAIMTVTSYQNDNSERAGILHERIRQFQHQIEGYIYEISKRTSDPNNAAYILLLTSSNIAFSEIGLISERLQAQTNSFLESDAVLSDENRKELYLMARSIMEIFDLTISDFKTKNPTLSGTIQLYREVVMEMGDIVKRRRIRQIHGKDGRSAKTTIFSDISYTQEQLMDYCDIVADAIIKYCTATEKNPDFNTDKTEKHREQIRLLFSDKCELLHIVVNEDGTFTDISDEAV